MPQNQYKISIFKHTPLTWLGLISIIVFALLSFVNIGVNPIIFGSAGLFFSGIVLLSIRQLLASLRNYVIVAEKGLEISSVSGKYTFDWSEITQMGMQALVSKTMGIMEAVPYLAISFVEPGKNKLSNFDCSKSAGLFQRSNDLSKFMGEPKMDLYVNLRLLEEKDAPLGDFLARQPGYIQRIKPLVKTTDQAEYTKILSENFETKE